MTANSSAIGSAPAPSTRQGMGAMLFPGGVAFRVWAPFAPQVFVAGSFNQWSATAHPFASEGNGYWSVEVEGAKVGDEYQFVIPTATDKLWHKNPYASAVVSSSGNAIIHDPNFDWTGDDFTMPPWNELVIYEMHVGTFNDTTLGHPGTFDGVTAKLPYLQELGINAIEIMPVSEYSMDYSWGYNPGSFLGRIGHRRPAGALYVYQGGACPRDRCHHRRGLQSLWPWRSGPVALRWVV
jgi:1,4-alpha-glucan branching enzyme